MSLQVGLGLRRPFIHQLSLNPHQSIDFLEVAPENFIGRGGQAFADFEKLTAIYPMSAHGLTLACGDAKLDWEYLKELKKFLKNYSFKYFTDHLCLSSYKNNFFHDLIPLPQTREFCAFAAERARQIQDFLELPFGVENISFYAHPVEPEMTEAQFIAEFLHQSGVSLMLDINNVYVNSFNHQSEAHHFIDTLLEFPILQCHLAGHFKRNEKLIIDTHGEPVIQPVWDLLEYYFKKSKKPAPILLERDHHIPALNELLNEVNKVRTLIQKLDL